MREHNLSKLDYVTSPPRNGSYKSNVCGNMPIWYSTGNNPESVLCSMYKNNCYPLVFNFIVINVFYLTLFINLASGVA